MTKPEGGPQKHDVPRWVGLARAFFEESKIDLEAESLMEGTDKEGILRRRYAIRVSVLGSSSDRKISVPPDDS